MGKIEKASCGKENGLPLRKQANNVTLNLFSSGSSLVHSTPLPSNWVAKSHEKVFVCHICFPQQDQEYREASPKPLQRGL